MPTLLNVADMQEQGVPGLFTPKGFQIAWTDYQQHMVDELNASTSGMLALLHSRPPILTMKPRHGF
jgi:superoxide dismutase